MFKKIIKRAVVAKKRAKQNKQHHIKPSHDFWFKIQHNEWDKRNVIEDRSTRRTNAM